MAIAIVYDPSCDVTKEIALNIIHGIEEEDIAVTLIDCNNPDYEYLDSCKLIVFGCPTGRILGVSENMANFMRKSEDRFENQVWKNKLSAGFTTIGNDSPGIIEDFCRFAAKHSMLWIPQGRIEENEGRRFSDVNLNKSYLGCISRVNDITAMLFGKRLAKQSRLHLFPRFN